MCALEHDTTNNSQERVMKVVDRLENHIMWGSVLVWIWRALIEKKAFDDEDHDSSTLGMEQWDWLWQKSQRKVNVVIEV